MVNFKLGEEEQYDIDMQFAENYEISEGTISPFTRLRVVIVKDDREEIDIKEPSVDTGVDIKEVISDDALDVDIKEINSNDDSDVDIKEVSPDDDSGVDIKEVKK